MTADATDRERLAEVLAAHEVMREPRVYPEFECSCGEWHGAQGDDGSETDGQNDTADAARAHVADALAGMLAEARAEALREVAQEARERGDIGKDSGCEAWEWLSIRAEQAAGGER